MPKIIFKIAPYKIGSAGARVLKEALDNALSYSVEKVDSEYRIGSNEWIINWGNGNFRALRREDAEHTKVLNPARKVCHCINKLDFFRILSEEDVTIPKWTISQETARKWLENGGVVYCRGDLEGHDGRGIEVARTPQQVISSHLYTLGIESDKEFRVHVFKHKPIFDLVKWHERPNKQNAFIRSGSNGWEYSRHVEMPDIAHQEAIQTSKALNMDFCAVDILYNSKTNVATVLEANSAPELGPWTSKAYVKELLALTK